MANRAPTFARFLLIALRREILLLGARLSPSSGIAKSQSLIISGSVEGSVGDAALLDSLVHALEGDVKYITADRPGFKFDVGRKSATGIHLPNIFRVRPIGNFLDVFRLGALIGASGKVLIIGADIADGTYSETFSHVLWDTAIAGRILKKSVTVVGFSWNASVSIGVRNKASVAQEIGVLCGLRDPLSYERFSSHSRKGVFLTADIVFSKNHISKQSHESRAIENFSSPLDRVALINVSGLISNSREWRDAFRSVTAYLISQNYKVVFIPHVFRMGQSDLEAQNQLSSEFNRETTYLIQRELSPAEVLGIIDKVDLVITGRMHLGILALIKFKPTLIISTQGKVEGLMMSINRNEWTIHNSEELICRTSEIVDNWSVDQKKKNDLVDSVKLLRMRSNLNITGPL